MTKPVPHYFNLHGAYVPLTEGIHFDYTKPDCDSCIVYRAFPIDARLTTDADGRTFFAQPVVMKELASDADAAQSLTEELRRYRDAAQKRHALWKAKISNAS